MMIQIQIKGDAQTARLYVSGKRRETHEGEVEITISTVEALRLLSVVQDWLMVGHHSAGGFEFARIVESLTGKTVYLRFPGERTTSPGYAYDLGTFYTITHDRRAVNFTTND